jgi:hypothetical protein
MITTKSTKVEVLEAVKQNGYALKYASEELRGDKELVLEAVKNNPLAFDFAGEELQKDIDVMAEVLRHIINATYYKKELTQ